MSFLNIWQIGEIQSDKSPWLNCSLLTQNRHPEFQAFRWDLLCSFAILGIQITGLRGEAGFLIACSCTVLYSKFSFRIIGSVLCTKNIYGHLLEALNSNSISEINLVNSAKKKWKKVKHVCGDKKRSNNFLIYTLLFSTTFLKPLQQSSRPELSHFAAVLSNCQINWTMHNIAQLAITILLF